jgi:hypothetical protein
VYLRPEHPESITQMTAPAERAGSKIVAPQPAPNGTIGRRAERATIPIE